MLKAFLVLVLFSASVQAGVVVTYSEQNKPYFTMEIPDTWDVNVGIEADLSQIPEDEQPVPRVITTVPGDHSKLWFGAWVPVFLDTMDAAQAYLYSLDDFMVDNPVIVKAGQENLNTMPARYYRGKGEKFGKPVDFFVMLFELSKENIGVAIYIGPPETTAAHLDELRSMMKSISPAR